MDYYNNAEEQLESAIILANAGKYRTAVTMICLACELFLKSAVEKKDIMNPLLTSHDIINLGNLLKNDIDMHVALPKLKFLRKYLNDSRYPFNVNIYTKEFYDECLDAVTTIKFQIDTNNPCTEVEK